MASIDVAAPSPPDPEPEPSPRRAVRRADTPQQAFGSRLRTARARAGLTLQGLADDTKVGASLFAALEEGDISRWPRGIYRRSFFRQYVEAVGLPMEETCEQFAHVFADELVPVTAPSDVADAPAAAPLAEHPAVRVLLAMLEWLTRKLSVA